MLFKKFRLNKEKDIADVVRKGRVIKGDFLTLKFLKNSLDYSRFGFIVSLKNMPSVVLRNKTKRRLREVVRTNLEKIKPGFDVVIFTQKGIESKNYKQIKSSLINLFKISRLFK